MCCVLCAVCCVMCDVCGVLCAVCCGLWAVGCGLWAVCWLWLRLCAGCDGVADCGAGCD